MRRLRPWLAESTSPLSSGSPRLGNPSDENSESEGEHGEFCTSNCTRRLSTTLVRDTVHPSQFGEEPYIGLEHIGEGTLSLLDIGAAKEVSSAKTRFQSGDILFGKLFAKLRPDSSKAVRPHFHGICSTDIWVVRPTYGVDADFLFHLIASHQFVSVAMMGSEGTTMPRAKWDHVSRLRVSLPPISEQQEIAEILRAFDDKIDMNRKMNETLEEMARTLFKSWFVGFEPVRAKMEGRWRLGESLPGLPARLFDFFPDRLVSSELGEIPGGWDVHNLDSQLSELVSGARPKGGAVDSGVPSIGAENVNGLGIYDYAKEKYIPEEFFNTKT